MSVLTTVLSSIGIKDYVYGALIAALLATGATWYIHHNHVEQQIGATKVITSDQKAVAAQVTHNTQIEATANGAVHNATQTYNHSISSPTLPPPSIVCHSTARSSGSVSSNASTTSRSNGGASVPKQSGESTEPAWNPSEQVLRQGQLADAQVKLLIAYVKACQAEGVCKTK